MPRLFNTIPSGFFNCLSSAGNNQIYSDCLQLIYDQYEREVSYRIARSRIRDALASYLLENQVNELEPDLDLGLNFDGNSDRNLDQNPDFGREADAQLTLEQDRKNANRENVNREGTASLAKRNYNDLANAVIRRFCSKEIGWLEEDTDDATYEKHIEMTEQGILLAEFLQQLKKPEREEFSSYLYNIYNILHNEDQWKQEPYVNGLKNIYRNAKMLSKSLKRLSTFIRKIIERMAEEETLESLTENVIEYCEGDFIREYARLTKQQNIHLYRTFIRQKLDEIQNNQELYEQLAEECAREEELEHWEAENAVLDMIQATRNFLTEDYDKIMRDIKHKINVYLQIAIGRARFIRNQDTDVRGSVEQTIRCLAREMRMVDWKDPLGEDLQSLFCLEKNEFLDLDSLRYPRKVQRIRRETVSQFQEMTSADVEQARLAHERESYNPYSKDRMKQYLDHAMAESLTLKSEDLPLEKSEDLLCALSAVAYANENGYVVEPADGYVEADHLLLRRFEIRRIDREDKDKSQ
ncbi:Wadjet anti-phage system protein JetA family protein [Brotaphodocola sp.]|uniref:Wadjet anti-phage system protein JetA family protein n=1 Tax=Brotaphodocola sp. TaxID=3073577 RepID=UPI003D7DD1AF